MNMFETRNFTENGFAICSNPNKQKKSKIKEKSFIILFNRAINAREESVKHDVSVDIHCRYRKQTRKTKGKGRPPHDQRRLSMIEILKEEAQSIYDISESETRV